MKAAATRRAHVLAIFVGVLPATPALAGDPAAPSPAPPGYVEPIVHWGVQKGETCEDIASAVYGSVTRVDLLLRYNRVTCVKGRPLVEGSTLILPEKASSPPDAKLRSVNPEVRAKPPGGSWSIAAPGTPLYSNASVNSRAHGRADIEFLDHSRIYIAENTLVVIYGTASRARVSKTPPPTVELQEGEVKAGLSALRGEPIDVGLPGGGRVSATSRDAVVERKGERNTVTVFEGHADVSSAGKHVNVPENFATRFVGANPPAPPRALPPAPIWGDGGTDGVQLAPGGLGALAATWSAVPRAKSYRFEIAHDADFRELVAREEVPASVLAFRAEKMPPGDYWMRVRAVDDEDYLGLAAKQRAATVVAVGCSGAAGTIGAREIRANPYAVLDLQSPAGSTTRLELAIDDGPFGPAPASIALAKQTPSKLRFRVQGSATVTEIPVHYDPVGVALDAKPTADRSAIDVSAKLSGAEGIDVAAVIGPRARVRVGSVVREAALVIGAGGVFTARVPLDGAIGGVRVDVTDGGGRLLATTTADVAVPVAPSPPRPRPPVLGVGAPLVAPSPITNVPWWSPTAPNAASLSVAADTGKLSGAASDPRNPSRSIAIAARASGHIGPIGIDAAAVQRAYGRSGEDGAWFGVRGRTFRLASGALEQGLALRIGLPFSATAPAPRLEPSAAIGGTAGRFGWLVDVGARVRLQSDALRVPTPGAQGFLIAGGTLDLTRWARAFLVVDGHVLGATEPPVSTAGPTTSSLTGGLGLGLGLESGYRAFFASLSARAAPLPDVGGLFAGQLAIGIREP